jgi:hypothetical protein
MSKDEFWVEIEKRFPGFDRLFAISRDGALMFLNDLLHPDSSGEAFNTFKNEYPLLYEYLNFDDSNPHLSPGPIHQVYQALSDLMKLAADMDKNVE